MEPIAHADRSPSQTRWRVAVDVEFVVEAEDQQSAISEAENLVSQVMPSRRPPKKTKVDVVMSLPIRVGRQHT
jgi:hypothetical protein